MKTSVKIFACAFMAVLALMSCDNAGGEQNLQGNPIIKSSCKQSISSLSDDIYDLYPNIDPACKSEDRIRVSIRDEQEIEFEVDGVYYIGSDYSTIQKCAKGIYVDGEYISMDELERRLANPPDPDYKESLRGEFEAYHERIEECRESRNSKARDIVVPCEIISSSLDRSWYALLTEEEIAELNKTYNDISIIRDSYVNDNGAPTGGNGEVASVPCLNK